MKKAEKIIEKIALYALLGFVLYSMFSCSPVYNSYTIKANVKTFNNDTLVSCGTENIMLITNGNKLTIKDLNLTNVDDRPLLSISPSNVKAIKNRMYSNQSGTLYDVYFDFNKEGILLTAIAANNKGYIISTSGKCQ